MTHKQLLISHLHEFGDFVANDGDHLYFCRQVLPEELVQANITKRSKSYSRTQVTRILTPSSHRKEAPCPLYSHCGNCQLMHADYSYQLELKRGLVTRLLDQNSIQMAVAPCIPSPEAYGYRSKLLMPVRVREKSIELGFYLPHSHELLPVNRCLLHNKVLEELRNKLSTILSEDLRSNRLSRTDAESIQHVLMRFSNSTNQALITLIGNSPPQRDLVQSLEPLTNHPSVAGILFHHKTKPGNYVMGGETVCLFGQPFVTETIGNLTFEISSESFFQTNVAAATTLFEQAISLAELRQDDTVIDIFSGTGIITLMAAKLSHRAIGIELVAQAVENAISTAKSNQIENVEFMHGDATQCLSNCDKASVIFLDPPRAGCSADLLRQIKRLSPSRLIYISCSPKTFARDAKLLEDLGFNLDKVIPFDLFPQTAHVEVVGLFKPQ